MSHVFISYKHGDFARSRFLDNLEDRLSTNQIVAWRDTSIRAGDNWEVEIDTAIDNCYALLLLMTDKVAESQYVTYEWTRAMTLNKTVIPLRLSETAIFHPRLEKTQFLDFMQSDEQSWKILVARLRSLKQSFIESQRIQFEILEAENRRMYTILKSLYDLRGTEITVEDLIDELRFQGFLSIRDFVTLIDILRKNQQDSKND